MPAFISIPLASFFVLLAGFNLWIMLTGRGATPRSRRIWTQIHRVCGYCFISLFVIFCHFMLLRIRSADELSPRIIAHLILALILAPLLLVKLTVVRYQKSAWYVLIALGVTIFAVAFSLVSMNVAVHYLRGLTPRRVPLAISLAVIIVVVVTAVGAFISGRKPAKPSTAASAVTSSNPRSDS